VQTASRLLPPLTLESTGKPTDNNELLKCMEELSRQVVTLSAERDRRLSGDRRSSSRDHSSSPRNRRPYNKSPLQ
jgi:hypothetical protein